MAQEQTDEVLPVARANASLTDVLATQHLLTDQSHNHRVLGIVIGCITVGDVLHSCATDECDDVGIERLQHAICVYVRGLQFAHEGFDDDLRRIKHDAHHELDTNDISPRLLHERPHTPPHFRRPA
jgi:hypothetical protein